MRDTRTVGPGPVRTHYTNPFTNPWDIAPGGVVHLGDTRPTLASSTQGAGRSNDVKALQRFLRNKGYNINIDGIRGPQTEAAVAAYHKGISARAWNTRSAHAGAKGPVGPTSRVQPHVLPRTGGSAAGGRRAPIRRITGPQTDPVAAANNAAASSDPNSLTEDQYIQALMDQQFGGPMSALQRQMSAAQAAGQAGIENLGRWYGEAAGTAGSIAGQTQQANLQLMQNQDTSNQNMVQLFGGPGADGSASGEAAAFAGINQAELGQMASAQQAYDANMVPIIKTQGVEARQAAQQALAAQMSDLAGQLSDLQNQRASASVTARQDYEQQQAQNQAAEEQLALARQLAGPKVQEARANAKLATSKANSYAQDLQIRLQNAGLSKARAQAYIKMSNARIAQIKAKSAKDAQGNIDMNDPNTLGVLQDNLRSTITTKNGSFSIHPGVARRTLLAQLQALGLGSNSAAMGLVGTVIQQALDRSHSLGLWRHVVYNAKNGGIVDKTGKRGKKTSKK